MKKILTNHVTKKVSELSYQFNIDINIDSILHVTVVIKLTSLNVGFSVKTEVII